MRPSADQFRPPSGDLTGPPKAGPDAIAGRPGSRPDEPAQRLGDRRGSGLGRGTPGMGTAVWRYPRDAGRIGLFQELSQIVGGCIHAGTARPHDDAAFRPRRLE